jgi:hypothetical protein
LSDRLGGKVKNSTGYNDQPGMSPQHQPIHQSNKQRNRLQRQINKNREREKRMQRPVMYALNTHEQSEAHPLSGSFLPSHDHERGVDVGVEVMESQSAIERLLDQPNHVIGARWRSQCIAAEKEQSKHQSFDQNVMGHVRRNSI